MKFKKYKALGYFHFMLIIVLFFYVPTQLKGQDILKDTIKEEASIEVKKERGITGGLQFEALALTGFVHIGKNPVLKLGAGFNTGVNFTNLILVAGETFSRPGTINYDKTEGEKKFYFENRGFYLYTNIRFSKFVDVSIGYKVNKTIVDHHYNDDGDGVRGKFKGFFLQPSFGKGKFQYACRLMAGTLSINHVSSVKPEIKEFGILMQPFILTIHFGRNGK